MIYHIVVGDHAAAPLKEAIVQEESMAGEVVILKDILNVGSIQKEEGLSFSQHRSQFWDKVINAQEPTTEVKDLENILEVSNELNQRQSPQVWFWMNPLPADVTAYFWLLPYFQKHANRFFIVNIAGLPFLDSNGKLIFPKSIAELDAKEIIKARKLARNLSQSEWVLDVDEWKQMTHINAGIRILEGGKKLAHRNIDHYDDHMLNLASATPIKASKLLQQTMNKNFIPAGDTFMAWRLRELIKEGKLLSKSDLSKPLKEIDVVIGGTLFPEETVNETISDTTE